MEKVDINRYSLVDLKSLEDDLLPAWLDLYETSFPPEERVLVSFLLRVIRNRSRAGALDYSPLAFLSPEQVFIGMCFYQTIPDLSIVYLWYLAMVPEVRNQGLGSGFYCIITERTFASNGLLVFEVEKPEEAHSEAQRLIRQRRIDFYRRNGAFLLNGISYLQSVGSHVPPTPMHIMVHLREPMGAEVIYTVAKELFHYAISQTGPLALT